MGPLRGPESIILWTELIGRLLLRLRERLGFCNTWILKAARNWVSDGIVGAQTLSFCFACPYLLRLACVFSYSVSSLPKCLRRLKWIVVVKLGWISMQKRSSESCFWYPKVLPFMWSCCFFNSACKPLPPLQGNWEKTNQRRWAPLLWLTCVVGKLKHTFLNVNTTCLYLFTTHKLWIQNDYKFWVPQNPSWEPTFDHQTWNTLPQNSCKFSQKNLGTYDLSIPCDMVTPLWHVKHQLCVANAWGKKTTCTHLMIARPHIHEEMTTKMVWQSCDTHVHLCHSHGGARQICNKLAIHRQHCIHQFQNACMFYPVHTVTMQGLLGAHTPFPKINYKRIFILSNRLIS